MIERHYFISARKNHNDGSASFSFNYAKFSVKSWLPRPTKALEEAISALDQKMKNEKGGKLEIICFCRC